MSTMTKLTDIARSPGDPAVVAEGPSSLSAGHRGARSLGWISIGIGVAELLAAPAVARALGIEGREALIRACGARELASGVVCLSVNPAVGLAMRAGR